jgi:hypothetical protein
MSISLIREVFISEGHHWVDATAKYGKMLFVFNGSEEGNGANKRFNIAQSRQELRYDLGRSDTT